MTMLDTLPAPPFPRTHNNPPPLEEGPFDVCAKEIGDLYGEARLWLDGAAVTTQEHADGLGNLLDMIRKAEKKADHARAAEKKPFDDGAKAVQAKYKPLLERAQLAADACKKALAPWLARIEREKREAAEKARLEAEQREWLAQQAIQEAAEDDLDARAGAEARVKAAQEAAKDARRAEKDTAKAGGATGRVVSLRTIHYAVLVDFEAALAHYREANAAEFTAALQTMADRDVRQGKRQIPGFNIIEEKVAV